MLDELHLALLFSTRLPLPPMDKGMPGGLARAMRFFPIAGVVVGAIGAAVYALAHLLLPPALAAVLALAASAWTTGCLHEDGLADLADGFGGGADKPRKLEIMRDSRIGTYGLVAVALALMLRAGALAALGSPWRVAGALIAAHALGRAAMPLVMQLMRPARSDGLGANAGQPERLDAAIAAAIALVIAGVVLPIPAALLAVVAALLASAAVVGLALHHLGGHTGDVLGAVEQAAETFALLGVVAAL